MDYFSVRELNKNHVAYLYRDGLLLFLFDRWGLSSLYWPWSHVLKSTLMLRRLAGEALHGSGNVHPFLFIDLLKCFFPSLSFWFKAGYSNS